MRVYKRKIKRTHHISKSIELIIETLKEFEERQRFYQLEKLKTSTDLRRRTNIQLQNLNQHLNEKAMWIVTDELKLTELIGYTANREDDYSYRIKGERKDSTNLCVEIDSKNRVRMRNSYKLRNFLSLYFIRLRDVFNLDLEDFILDLSIRWQKESRIENFLNQQRQFLVQLNYKQFLFVLCKSYYFDFWLQ